MKKMICLLATLFLSISCANTPGVKKSQTAAVVKSHQVLEVEKKMREREDALQDLRDRNQVLNKKTQLESPTVKLQARPQHKAIEMSAPSGKPAQNAQELYSELNTAYSQNNEIAFYSRLQTFQKQYVQSPLMDDALYLAGLMSLSNKNYGPALRYFNQILMKHAKSNRTSSALFAKGITLKKMNLTDESRVAFVKVRKTYPGSPESLRAETELKLLAK